MITIGAYLPESYAAEPCLRVDFTENSPKPWNPRRSANSPTNSKTASARRLPVSALLLETEIRCLAETIGLDLETNGDRLACRFAKNARKGKMAISRSRGSPAQIHRKSRF